MASRINLVRLRSVIKKEFRQTFRDKSTLVIGILLPIILLILFGYGMSFDIQHQSVIIVKEKPSPVTDEVFMAMKLTPYFTPRWASSWQEAEKEFVAGKADGIVRVEQISNLSNNVQIIVNGSDANTARIMEMYIRGAVLKGLSKNITVEGFKTEPASSGGLTAISRIWFNPAAQSTYFMIPGVIVIILSIVGSMLTAMVIAREWERGTFETLVSTEVSRFEIMTSKVLPTFCLGIIGLVICLLACYFVFDVPIRGSLLLVFLSSSLYLFIALCLGLTVSALTKSQFLSSQIVLVFSFLPTLIVTDYLFDLKSAPLWAKVVSVFFPATWFVELLASLFLVGNVKSLMIKDFAALILFAAGLAFTATKNIKKTLE